MSDEQVWPIDDVPGMTNAEEAGNTAMTQDDSATRFRRRRSGSWSRHRSVIVGVIGGVLVGVLVGALMVSAAYPRPDRSAISVAQQPVRVTVAVSEQPVRQVASLSGTVTAPTVVAVIPNADNGSGPEVVSGHVHAVGDPIKAWDVIAEVSNRPVFAVLGSVPLFRDLAPDMTGTDVRAVQQSLIDAGWLKSGPSGTMDLATSNAVAALFKAAGYVAPVLASVNVPQPDPVTGIAPDPPQRAGLPLADTAGIPAAGVPVTQAAPVGQVVDADHPLVSVTTQAAVISVRADMLAAPSFQVGADVMVQVGSNPPIGSTVLSVSAFDSGGSGVPPGYDVTVAVPDGVDAAQVGSVPVTVTQTDQPATGSAVPLLAIRTDGQGSFVWKAAADDQGLDVRVGVTVTSQANGYAILDEDPQLPVGTQVVLSGERS